MTGIRNFISSEVRPLEYRCLMGDRLRQSRLWRVHGSLSALHLRTQARGLVEEAGEPVRGQGRRGGRYLGVGAMWIPCVNTWSSGQLLATPGSFRTGMTYANSIDTENSPPGVHVTVDNRYGMAIATADRTRETLRRLLHDATGGHPVRAPDERQGHDHDRALATPTDGFSYLKKLKVGGGRSAGYRPPAMPRALDALRQEGRLAVETAPIRGQRLCR